MKPDTPRPSEASSSAAASSMGGWVSGGSFFGSIISGTLLGYLADRWLGTDPWLVIIGIVVGSYSGFMRMWQLSKLMETGHKRRGQMGPGQIEAGPDDR